MHFRTSVQKRADGTRLTHFQIAESYWYWDRQLKKGRAPIIYNVGCAEDPSVTDRLSRLAKAIQRWLSPDEPDSTPASMLELWLDGAQSMHRETTPPNRPGKAARVRLRSRRECP